MRTDVVQVPVAASTESFSSRPLMAPPPLGAETEGSRSIARGSLGSGMPSLSATSASRLPSCGSTSTPRIGVTHLGTSEKPSHRP